MQKESTLRKVVILLFIAAVVGVVLVVGTNTIKKTQISSCQRNIDQLWAAVQEYYNDNQSFPAELDIRQLTLLRPPLPRDPATGKNYIYELLDEGRNFKISCPSPKNHGVKEIYITAGMTKQETIK